jgi:hypothetical protein
MIRVTVEIQGKDSFLKDQKRGEKQNLISRDEILNRPRVCMGTEPPARTGKMRRVASLLFSGCVPFVLGCFTRRDPAWDRKAG